MEEETRNDAGALLPVKIVAGNKCDLKELREVPARTGLEWARGRGAGFMETSARECVNIEETFACTFTSLRPPPQHSLPLFLPLPALPATVWGPFVQIGMEFGLFPDAHTFPFARVTVH